MPHTADCHPSRELLEQVESELRSDPTLNYGHPSFIRMALKEIELHALKNHDYAKGGDPLGNFKRVASIMRLYPGFPWDSPAGCAVVQMLKQIDAALWMTAQRTEAKVETPKARWADVSVFAKLISILQGEDP